jgi:phosphate/phosphite/phosphonate ABC transporter binding protein
MPSDAERADTELDYGEPAVEADEPAPGERLGRYVVQGKIGTGGMGVVLAARDLELDRPVAIKLVRAELNKGPGASLLKREAQALAQLSHPNVVGVYDVGSFHGQVFIAMELVVGQSLGAWLREAPRPWREILTRFLAAGRGLAAAHALGIVHRDFKPDNVLCGQDGRVRVVDFGLARAVGGSERPTVSSSDNVLGVMLTRTGAVVGTPAFMAPEQYIGGTMDGRTDQFSFCVALHYALYGQRPFAGDSMAELSEAVQNGRITPHQAPPGLPRRVREAILRGLSASREARFASMDDLLAEIEAALERAAPRESRRRRALAGGLAFVAALAAGLAWWALAPGGGGEPAESHESIAAGLPGTPLRLAIVQYYPIEMQRRESAVLARAFMQVLERPVTVAYLEPEKVSGAFQRGELDLAVVSPLWYVRLRREVPTVELLAKAIIQGSATYQAMLVTRADGGLHTIDSLRDKVVCWVAPGSTSGYLIPRALLRSQGHDPDRFFRSSLMTGNHVASLRALSEKKCDVAAMFSLALYGAREPGLSAGMFQVVATTPAIPNEAEVARAGLEELDRLKKGLLSIGPESPAGKTLRGAFPNIEGFVPTSEADYDGVRVALDEDSRPPR